MIAIDPRSYNGAAMAEHFVHDRWEITLSSQISALIAAKRDALRMNLPGLGGGERWFNKAIFRIDS